MKKIFFIIFTLSFSLSYSQYAVLTLWKYEDGGRIQAREIILDEFKKVAEKRIADGNLDGYHVWQSVVWSDSNQYDLIIAELYDDLEKFYKKRGLQNNLNFGAWSTHKVWSDFLSSVALVDRIIIKNEAFENTKEYLPKLGKFNFFKKKSGNLGSKWVETHKKFSKFFVENQSRDAWGSWSVIHKSFKTPFDHMTIDLYDFNNEMDFIMNYKPKKVDASAIQKFWGKQSPFEARTPTEMAFYTQLLIL